eukprot:gene52367-70037_t
MDIELLAEMAALLTGSPARGVERQIEAGRKGGILSDSDATGLLEAYRLMWRLQAGTRLITDGALDPAKLGEGACAFLLRETGEASAAALSDRLEAVAGLAEAARRGRGMGRRAVLLSEADPKGLVRESYRIDGITAGECRSIFVDWALSLPVDAPIKDAVRTLMAEYALGAPDHPMSAVLKDGLMTPDAPKRRGGRAARVGGA